MPSVIRHDVTGNTTEQETVQLPAADVQGGPPVTAPSVTPRTRPCPHGCPAPGLHTHLTGGGEPVEFGPADSAVPVLRTVCSWCLAEGRETVIVDGPRDAQGRSSHGICSACATKQTAEILAQIVVYPPLHVIPAQDRIGGYVIRDDRDRLIVDNLSGVNSAAAIAHTLNNAIHGYGLCLLHLNEKRPDGTCFACAIGVGRHLFSAVGRPEGGR